MFNVKRTFKLAFTLVALGAFGAEVKVPVKTESRLQTLERKASEYEHYRAQYFEMQETLDSMLALLGEKSEPSKNTKMSSGFGKLSRLIEKAEQADKLSREVEKIKEELDRLQEMNDALKKEIASARTERDEALASIDSMKDASGEWEEKAAGLRETVERLLLGEFEYYEVKEGDTLAGIAANPLIYGDPARAVWLKQANERRVKHIENLRPGEVIVIPRFPRSGAYEF